MPIIFLPGEILISYAEYFFNPLLAKSKAECFVRVQLLKNIVDILLEFICVFDIFLTWIGYKAKLECINFEV